MEVRPVGEVVLARAVLLDAEVSYRVERAHGLRRQLGPGPRVAVPVPVLLDGRQRGTACKVESQVHRLRVCQHASRRTHRCKQAFRKSRGPEQDRRLLQAEVHGHAVGPREDHAGRDADVDPSRVAWSVFGDQDGRDRRLRLSIGMGPAVVENLPEPEPNLVGFVAGGEALDLDDVGGLGAGPADVEVEPGNAAQRGVAAGRDELVELEDRLLVGQRAALPGLLDTAHRVADRGREPGELRAHSRATNGSRGGQR